MNIEWLTSLPGFSLWKKIQQGVLTVLMLLAVLYFYQPEKPVMAYLEYLPVYRVELRWEQEQEVVVSSSEEKVVVGQK